MQDILGDVPPEKPSREFDPKQVEQERIAAMDEVVLFSLPFPRAAELWLEQHKRYIKPNTLKNYRNSMRLLIAFLGEVLVKDIHIGHIRAYQNERSVKAGHYLINGELSVLQMIMKEARCWKALADFYRPLRVPKRRGGHSISEDQERRLREVAFSRPKWRLAAHCMMVMLSTTMGFGELRHVRRRDVDMRRKSILVRDGAKNEYRDRTIPMNAAAYDSMCWILERWEKLGGSLDSDFILPHRPKVPQGPWILTEPMKAITTAFNRIRAEAGLPAFRVYDCRVQAITKLLSNPAVHPQVSKEIAGHISQAMQDRYSIQQYDTKLAALEALDVPRIKSVKQQMEEVSRLSANSFDMRSGDPTTAPKKPVEKISEIPLALSAKEAYGSVRDENIHNRGRSERHPSGDREIVLPQVGGRKRY